MRGTRAARACSAPDLLSRSTIGELNSASWEKSIGSRRNLARPSPLRSRRPLQALVASSAYRRGIRSLRWFSCSVLQARRLRRLSPAPSFPGRFNRRAEARGEVAQKLVWGNRLAHRIGHFLWIGGAVFCPDLAQQVPGERGFPPSRAKSPAEDFVELAGEQPGPDVVGGLVELVEIDDVACLVLRGEGDGVSPGHDPPVDRARVLLLAAVHRDVVEELPRAASQLKEAMRVRRDQLTVELLAGEARILLKPFRIFDQLLEEQRRCLTYHRATQAGQFESQRRFVPALSRWVDRVGVFQRRKAERESQLMEQRRLIAGPAAQFERDANVARDGGQNGERPRILVSQVFHIEGDVLHRP